MVATVGEAATKTSSVAATTPRDIKP